MKKYSIVVPVYNIERKYLEPALDSVIAQTYANWECICVDDGSTNDARSVLDAYARKDSRFSVFHHKNRGVGSARNFAIQHATGEWVVFLDGDDLLSPHALETLATTANSQNDLSIIRFKFNRFYENCIFNDDKPTSYTLVNLTIEIPKSLAEVYVWEFAFRQDVALCVPFTDLLIGEDTLFVLECLRKCCKYVEIDAALYGYRCRATSTMQSAITDKKLLSRFTSSIERLKLFEEYKRTNHMYEAANLTRFIVHDYITLTCHAINARDRPSLWNAWFAAMPFLSSRHEFNAVFHAIFVICDKTRSKIASYLLCGVFLAAAWRLRLPFAKAINPSNT